LTFCKDCGTELEMLSIEGKFLPYCTGCKAWVIENKKQQNLLTNPPKPNPVIQYFNEKIEQMLKSYWFWAFWIGFIAGEIIK
jgi:hypothetical protein